MGGADWRLSVVVSDLNFDGFIDVLVVACNIAEGYSELLLYFGARRAPSQLSEPPAAGKCVSG